MFQDVDDLGDKRDARRRNVGLLGAVVGAVLASLCCLGPLVLLALGLGGAWAGNLTALEPYRPIFIVFAMGALGAAFYRVYRRPREQCEPGSVCENSRAGRVNKIVLWIVTVGVAALVAIPWLIGPSGQQGRLEVRTGHRAKQTREVSLVLENMTCGGCVVTATKALQKARGVVKVVVTLKPPRAVVTYDAALTSPQALSEATRNAGYPSRILRDDG